MAKQHCSAIVTFINQDGDLKAVELCSYEEAFEYCKEVIFPQGWSNARLISITRGCEYGSDK